MTPPCVALIQRLNNGGPWNKFHGLGCQAANRRYIAPLVWRDGRVAEGARLESVYTGNRIVGSNPTLSASNRLQLFVALKSSSTRLMKVLRSYEGMEVRALEPEPMKSSC
jgi:hypothetical protein